MSFWKRKILTEPDYVNVDVVDVEAARLWYSEKLGLTYSATNVQDLEADAVVGYSENDPRVYLCRVVDGKRPNAQPGHPQILLTTKLDDAYEFLSSKGVDAGPLQKDSGGNRFFRFRDLEGNELEVYQHS